MYMLQSVVHSLVALFIVEMSLRIWSVEDSHERFRYRLLVMVLPFIMFPAFQFINPERGSFYFIQDSALFSSLRWVRIEMFGKMPFAYAFLCVVSAVAVIVILQEILPIVRDRIAEPRGFDCRHPDPAVEAMVTELSVRMGVSKPSVCVIDDERPFIFTSGTKAHTIVISEPLFRLLDMRQLRSALAHELAHIVRRSNVTTLLVFFIRIFMFYNPVSLLEFRMLVQDDEHICDDITVSITRDPEGLASALRLFWLDMPQREKIRLAEVKQVIETSSHNLQLHERIVRLEEGRAFTDASYGWGRFGATLATIVVMNYFIV